MTPRNILASVPDRKDYEDETYRETVISRHHGGPKWGPPIFSNITVSKFPWEGPQFGPHYAKRCKFLGEPM